MNEIRSRNVSRDVLSFLGTVTAGIGKYSALVFPDRTTCAAAPPDWPPQLFAGSLNVKVATSGYPKRFKELGTRAGVKRFDEKRFVPAFVIPRSQIKENRLGPMPENLDGGDAQVWRARLHVLASGATEACWLVRRIGSGYRDILELVSEHGLRQKLDLVEGAQVQVDVNGAWR